MKYISYFLTAVASTLLVILLSLSSYHSLPQSTIAVEQSKVSSQNSPTTVKIVNFKYEPASLKVAVGETVKFINQDEEPHTVTAQDTSFNSKALDTEQTWTHKFAHPGNFPYFCAIHPYMKGTIIVTPQRKQK